MRRAVAVRESPVLERSVPPAPPVVQPSPGLATNLWGSASKLFLLLYTAVAVFYGGRLMLSGLTKTLKFDWSRAPVGDAQVDWVAARLFLQHKSPYTPEGLQAVGVGIYGFGHPPTTPFWFIPLTHLDYGVFAQSVALATIACFMVGTWLTADELRFPAPLATTLLVSGGVLQTDWMQLHLHVIQISGFIAFAYVLGWFYLRRHRQVASGVALGVACTMKLFPGLLVALLAAARRWKAAAAAAATYAFVAIVMTRVYGLESWRLFFEQQKPIAYYWMNHIRNSSLHGIIIRFFSPSCIEVKGDPTAHVAALKKLDHIPSLRGSGWANLAALVCILAGGWLVLRYLRSRSHDARSHQSPWDLVFAFTTTLSAFINPWVWEHYSVLLILPVFICLDGIRHRWVAAHDELAKNKGIYRTVARFVAGSAPVLALIGISVWSLSQDIWKRETIHEYFVYKKSMTGQTPEDLHYAMHRAEIVAWLPYPCLILASGILMYWSIAAARSRPNRTVA